MVGTVERKEANSKDTAPISNVEVTPTEAITIPFDDLKANAAGRAFLEEASIIPLTSLERKTTTKWELIWYYLYYFGK
jgi:hypothetical protein